MAEQLTGVSGSVLDKYIFSGIRRHSPCTWQRDRYSWVRGVCGDPTCRSLLYLTFTSRLSLRQAAQLLGLGPITQSTHAPDLGPANPKTQSNTLYCISSHLINHATTCLYTPITYSPTPLSYAKHAKRPVFYSRAPKYYQILCPLVEGPQIMYNLP